MLSLRSLGKLTNRTMIKLDVVEAKEIEGKQEEWDKTYQQNLKELKEITEKGFTAEQRKRVKYLADAYIEMDPIERSAVMIRMNRLIKARRMANPITVHPWLLVKGEVDDDGNILAPSAQWQAESESLRKLMTEESLMKMIGLSAGSVGGGAAAQAPVAEKEEKAPVVEEKKAFDVELTSFEPAAKVKLIKEVKDMFKLGLKEAKDLVEKAPVVVKSGIPKEEADQLVAKLAELGCKASLK